eukprot:5592249-Amphidinium_carterae.1
MLCSKLLEHGFSLRGNYQYAQLYLRSVFHNKSASFWGSAHTCSISWGPLVLAMLLRRPPTKSALTVQSEQEVYQQIAFLKFQCGLDEIRWSNRELSATGITQSWE